LAFPVFLSVLVLLFWHQFLVRRLAKAGKPVAKAAIKGGIVFYEKSKIVMAEAGETFGDLVAQSKAELATEQDGSSIVQVSNHPETN